MFPASTAINKLTVLTVKGFAAPQNRPTSRCKKLSDGGSLYLVVTQAGTAMWRLKYTFEGKERAYSIGFYPKVSLEEARRERDRLKTGIVEGQDPVLARRIRRAKAIAETKATFQVAYEAWLAKKIKEWSKIHLKISARAFERDILPHLGRLPMNDINSAIVSGVVERIAKRGAIETAFKILQHINGVFRMAQAKGWCDNNPAAPVSMSTPSDPLVST